MHGRNGKHGIPQKLLKEQNMIVKIEPSNSNPENAFRYNERKMDENKDELNKKELAIIGEGTGYILATKNLPEGAEFIDVFDERRLLAQKKGKSGAKIKNEAFHMSVNPSETDRKLDDAEAVEMIGKIMEGLGYGNQPYRIYKHTDIEREHYHVVSCRIDENGMKIKADFERLELRKLLKKIQQEYGFSLIPSEHEEKMEQAKAKTSDKKEEKERQRDKKVPPFKRNSGIPVVEHVKMIVDDALTWNFSTYEQFQSILIRRYNVMLELEKGEEDKAIFSGTDENGNPVTPMMPEGIIHPGIIEKIYDKIAREKGRMRYMKEQRVRCEQLVRLASQLAKDYDQFVFLLNKKGIQFCLSFTESGEPFGITYIDRGTKCAWKGSETFYSMKWFKEFIKQKGWDVKKDDIQAVVDKRKNMPSRKAQPRLAAVKTQPQGDTSGNAVTKTAGPKLHVSGSETKGSSEQFGNIEGLLGKEDDAPAKLVK